MKKSKISFYFIFISFFTLLTIFFSIVQKSYFSYITPQKVVEDDALLNDFNPNLDLTAISIIEAKNKNTSESFDFSIIKSSKSTQATSSAEIILTPTPTIIEEVVSTASAEITLP